MGYMYRYTRARERELRAPYYALLDAVIEGGYTVEGARRVIMGEIERLRKLFMELSAMSDEEFFKRSPFAMGTRLYAMENVRRAIRFYKQLLSMLDEYAKLCRENQGLLDMLIRERFVGRLREAREAFRRLCGNVTGGLTRWIGGGG